MLRPNVRESVTDVTLTMLPARSLAEHPSCSYAAVCGALDTLAPCAPLGFAFRRAKARLPGVSLRAPPAAFF